MDKAAAQRIHAKRRAGERLGFGVTSAELRRLANLVQQQDGICEGRKTNRISIWVVDGKRVAYDKKRGTIASILPNAGGEGRL